MIAKYVQGEPKVIKCVKLNLKTSWYSGSGQVKHGTLGYTVSSTQSYLERCVVAPYFFKK